MNSLVRNIQRTPDVSGDGFRSALRELAGGVSIITAGSGTNISGMTVTSLSSLSADPPRLIVCVNLNASSLPLIRHSGFFGVSVLGSAHQHIAERFSNSKVKGAERFAGADWITLASGTPLLADAAAAIECEVEEIIERHSHAILIGRPVALRVNSGHPGLVYWQGEYVAAGSGHDEESTAARSLSRALWQV